MRNRRNRQTDQIYPGTLYFVGHILEPYIKPLSTGISDERETMSTYYEMTSMFRPEQYP